MTNSFEINLHSNRTSLTICQEMRFQVDEQREEVNEENR